MRKHNQSGFTLIELLVVVAIIGILAAIAIPQFAAYRAKGFDARAESDCRNAATAEEAYFVDFAEYSSTPADLPGVFGAAVGNVVPSVSRGVLRHGPDVTALRDSAARFADEVRVAVAGA